MSASAIRPAARAAVVAPCHAMCVLARAREHEALYELARAHGAALVVVEIYQGLTYGGPEVATLAVGTDSS
jgi:aspartate/methionine/tyrosine aminotransferase